MVAENQDPKSRQEKQQRSDAQLPERLATLGITGDQMRASLKPLVPPLHYRIEGFIGTPLISVIVPRNVSLSDSVCIFLHSGLRGRCFF